MSKVFLFGATGKMGREISALIEKDKKLKLTDQQLASKKIPVLWASNMSMGVNVLNQMLKNLNAIRDYDFYIEETHHIHKKDAPSGTALTIQKHLEKAIKKKVKDIVSYREGEVFGQHKVIVKGPEETILIQHDALNRTVFAKGAVTCAKWILKKKPGHYSIEDVLK